MDAPAELLDLFLGQHSLSKHFRAYIRTYNNSFAFSTLRVKYDSNLCTNEHNLYIFRVNDTMHHFINSLTPQSQVCRNLQLYFHDPNTETEARIANNPTLDRQLVALLTELTRLNPYATFFRQLYSMASLSDYRVYLKVSTRPDQRVYNLPTVQDISVIWQDGDGESTASERDIQVYPIDGCVKKIAYHSFAYDPVQYPFIHCYGQPGWHIGIVKKRGFFVQANAPTNSLGPQAVLATPDHGPGDSNSASSACNCCSVLISFCCCIYFFVFNL